ncbi:hypothetical protein DL96DRAFT_1609360 [Flagelloscypha sp. PMI_526]|nr:hypothetical protein DL96DRAFT_1609360 [Flagelloscypha sp. PMI_526]
MMYSLKQLSQVVFQLFPAALDSSSPPPGLAPTAFVPLPLTSIYATGWLHDQLVVQMNGLAGHLHEFYDYVSETDWVGGTSAYSLLEEAGSYWFNAMVPHGVLLNNEEIIGKTKQFLHYVLEHQEESGWLGPEANTNKPKLLWGRYPFFFGAVQLMEAYPELINTTIPPLHKFVHLANSMLKNNGEGVDNWAATRWEDFVVFLQWLYEHHPEGNEALLLETMKLLKWTGAPWEEVFKPQNFPTTAVEDPESNPFPVLTWHGVNIAEGLKALPSTYRFTHNTSDLEAASDIWDRLYRYHGRPSGAFGADEFLSGQSATRGTELCLVVESMFSGSYLFQVTGDLKYADRVERMTFNALPATLTGDMWQRQYLQQQNQVAAKNMTPNPFPEDGPYSNVFGLEPNYPCCTVDFPQGWPKFVTNSFVATPDNTGLVQVYIGPFDVKTSLANGNAVSVKTKTLYPFSDSLQIIINADSKFDFFIRIPSWVEGGSLSINDGPSNTLRPVNGLQRTSIAAGVTTLKLHLPALITTEQRPGGSVAIHRGPLNYAFDIPRSQKIIAQDPTQPNATDLQFTATEDWAYAIDPTTLTFHDANVKELPSPIFDSGLSPFKISVIACLVDWKLAGDTYAADPPPQFNGCLGEKKNITLAPLGTTKLRISEFPVIVN